MQKFLLFLCFAFFISLNFLSAQTFTRSELSTPVSGAWEITWGPDDHLWITESQGHVSRIDPVTEAKQVVYVAPDYFSGDPSENHPYCWRPAIGTGTLGLALHPDFLDSSSSYIYYVYSYNSGTSQNPATKFKIVRLKWDANQDTVTATTDLVTDLPTGYDHLGGRLITARQNGNDYLYFSIGDNGISEDNSPDCYPNQALNPNNFTWDPSVKTGKIHRFNMDGSIPSDNPIPGNSFFSRGHRNPQGLMFNPSQELVYDAEHGDQTDDEVNVLFKGMNYGWKHVRGYHGDSNFPGEDSVLANYTPNPAISNDSLVPALHSFCATAPPSSVNYLDWCTVAPSGGAYYGNYGLNTIPQWENSLLVVTLKDGTNTDRAVWRIKLTADGLSKVPSTPGSPNPEPFFQADQSQNGRLRDIAISGDGRKIYLINSGGGVPDHITVYETTTPAGITSNQLPGLKIYPNPATNFVKIECEEKIRSVRCVDMLGKVFSLETRAPTTFGLQQLPIGVYALEIELVNGQKVVQRIIRD